ncbi:MAG TPA: alpha/beta fold hydrolase [Longimicrobiales bacterium]|nr:alpha/beta fold hydrolase [Longimicrobiales bacterium]
MTACGWLVAALLACAAGDPPRHLEGELSLRGDTWPVRLALEPGDPPRVTLDLPDMVMAWRPVPAQVSGDSITVEFPFGAGALRWPADARTVDAWRAIGDDTLRLTLRAAAAPPYTREPFTFANGPATLVGELVRPVTAGPHPAVVLVHGSAAQGRHSWGYRSYADLFARAGYAVLYYDKRGVGESTGAWMTRSYADIDELAGDVVAAVEALRSRPGVDGERIGLMGGSQAGWVSLLTARRTPIAWMVLRGAPAVTPAEQEAQSVEARLRADDLAQPMIDSALAHTRLYFRVVAEAHGADAVGAPQSEWERLVESSERARATLWGEYVQLVETEDDLFWWRRNYAVDPQPLLEELSVPALFMYGAADVVVPPAANVPILLRHTAGREVTVLVAPRANHVLEVPLGHDQAGAWHFPRRSPEALDAMMGWLEGRSP